MKKEFSLLIASLLAVTASAKIVRVCNLASSSAQYTSLQEAVDAAVSGDVIFVEASPNSYGQVTITTPGITLRGTGYYKANSGITSSTGESTLGEVYIQADSVKLESLVLNSAYLSESVGASILRCCIQKDVELKSTVHHVTISQNYFTNRNNQNIYGVRTKVNNVYQYPTHAHITNNIFGRGGCEYISNAYIAHNTVYYSSFSSNIYNSVMENNIANCSGIDGSTSVVNCESKSISGSNELAIYNSEQSLGLTDKGALSGDNPYVLSGLPSGPYFKSASMGTSVPQGGNISVTLDIQIQK